MKEVFYVIGMVLGVMVLTGYDFDEPEPEAPEIHICEKLSTFFGVYPFKGDNSLALILHEMDDGTTATGILVPGNICVD